MCGGSVPDDTGPLKTPLGSITTVTPRTPSPYSAAETDLHVLHVEGRNDGHHPLSHTTTVFFQRRTSLHPHVHRLDPTNHLLVGKGVPGSTSGWKASNTLRTTSKTPWGRQGPGSSTDTRGTLGNHSSLRPPSLHPKWVSGTPTTRDGRGRD